VYGSVDIQACSEEQLLLSPVKHDMVEGNDVHGAATEAAVTTSTTTTAAV
jgi:hypothetical protein